MTEPGSYLTAKIASAIGGLLGGATLMFYIKPKSIGEAFIRGGISVGSAIIFAAPLAETIGTSPSWESHLMCGSLVGFCAYFVLGMIANFFIKYQKKTPIDVISEITHKKQD
jgi:hypothetical protein